MVEGLRRMGKEDPSKDQSTIPDKRLRNFITSNTKNFFQMLTSPDSFLATWLSDHDYMVVQDIAPELHIVNDTAKQGVALMQKVNALLTKDEKIKINSVSF